jgi:hypothetical protein
LIYIRKLRFGLPWSRFPGRAGCALGDLSISFFHGHVSASFLFSHTESLLVESRRDQGKNQCQGKTPAEKETGKILPDARKAAGNPITTRSFNRDTHAEPLHHDG